MLPAEHRGACPRTWLVAGAAFAVVTHRTGDRLDEDRTALVGVVARGSTREVVADVDLLADLGLRAPPAVRLFDGLGGGASLTTTVARDRLERRTGLPDDI